MPRFFEEMFNFATYMKVFVTFLAFLGVMPMRAADFNIKNYGARNDTTVLSTHALQQAIDACTDAGGGRVVVPAGIYKIGTIQLKSHVHLYLEQGATLFGSTRPHLLRFIQSQDILVRGITLRNSGCWMQHYLACDRLMIDGIKVYNRNNYNNDALDIDGCHEVIEG